MREPAGLVGIQSDSQQTQVEFHTPFAVSEANLWTEAEIKTSIFSAAAASGVSQQEAYKVLRGEFRLDVCFELLSVLCISNADFWAM